MKLERVQEILKEVIERLQDHDMQTVATCESFTLQRWQEVPSTIASSRPTTPNNQISAAHSKSRILSEAGFSERSIPMSAYQFNDMETRGKGFLISDGTQVKAYTVRARKQKKGLDSKPLEAGVPSVGSSAAPSKLPTKTTRPALLASIPEPEEGDEALDVKDDSKPGMTIDSQTFIKTPSKKERPKPRGALRRARHCLKIFRKPRSKADLRTLLKRPEGGGAVHIPRDVSSAMITKAPPLRELAAPCESPKLAMKKFLWSQNSAPKNMHSNPTSPRKPVVRISRSSLSYAPF